MRIEFSHQLAAIPAKVYAALMDPSIIQRCIDGCESLTPAGENTYATRLRVGGASVKGTVKLISTRPGEALTLAIEAKGLPGSVKATVEMTLLDRGSATEVRGAGDVTVGGFVAALGAKIIESGTRGAISDFFSKLSSQITSSGT